MSDVLVIGAGLSGLMTAYTVARAGLTATVIAKGLGALHWTAGTIDVFGYEGEQHERPIQRPLDYIEQTLANEQPRHPYAILGKTKLQAALDDFVALSRAIGLPYVGATTPGENLLLPSAVGAVRPTFLVPEAQIGGDLSRQEPMVIVGFQGLRDFYPELIASNLVKQGFAARAAFLPLAVLTERSDSNTVQQAQGMDDAARRRKLADELKQVARPGERIGLPPILGLNQAMTALADVQTRTGAVVFEIPTLPPSVPGMRLAQALRRQLEKMGVRVEPNHEAVDAGFVSGAGAAPRIEWVASATSARPVKHRAQTFVLATGGIMGGGFNSDHTGRVWETVFNLPLTTPQRRSEWFRPTFANPLGHPVYTGGVMVDNAMQPIASTGNVIYENLWVVGDALAEDNPILQRSMEGAAIATAYAAGQAILHHGQWSARPR